MVELIPTIALEKIYSLLPAKEKSESKPSDLTELKITSNKRFVRKRFFKLNKSEGNCIHLTYGNHLSDLYEKSKSLYQLLPTITCKPLFLNIVGEEQLFGQEFFDGNPIDQCLEKSVISDNDVTEIIDELRTQLLSKIESSNITSWNKEFNEFQSKFLSNSNFLEVDKKCLELFIFPKLKNGLSTNKPKVRWSSGDLCARNILVNDHKDFRLIDFEFALKTHFFDEDWVRLAHFSSTTFKQCDYIHKLAKSTNRFQTIYFCLRQILLDQMIYSQEVSKYYASNYLLDLLLNIDNNENSLTTPLFFRGISNRINSNSVELEQRKWDLIVKDTKIKTISELYENRNTDVLNLKSKYLLEKETSNQKDLSIASLESDIVAEKEISKQKDLSIASLESDIVAQKEISKQKDLSIASLESDIVAQKEISKQKDLSIASLESDIVAQKEISKQKDLGIASLESDIVAEKEISKQKDLKIASLQQNVDSKINEVTDLNSQIEENRNYEEILKQQLEIKNDKIMRMQKSFSWKITGPLRLLRRYKEKIFKSRSNLGPISNSTKHSPTIRSISPNERVVSPFEFDDNFSKFLENSSNSVKYSSESFNFIWLIPDFGIGSGGHTTIFRMIMWLETFGHKSKIYICGGTHHGSAEKAKEIISNHFFRIDASVDIIPDPRILNNETSIIISTSYDTCYYSRNIDSPAARYYFVQDYEPQFASLGSYYYLAKNTYTFGFHCITAGKWLANKIDSVGGTVSGYFELAVDKSIFFPNSTLEENKKTLPTIAVYARTATARRLTELAIFGLNLLSQRGHQFKVIFFGDSQLPIQAYFEHQILGVVPPSVLAELYRSADVGCVFSGTNYSLVPLEMMACGLPIVEFDGSNTRETFPVGSVRFAKPNPISIADEIEFLLLNPQNNDQISKALDFTKELSWEKSARKFEDILKKELQNP